MDPHGNYGEIPRSLGSDIQAAFLTEMVHSTQVNLRLIHDRIGHRVARVVGAYGSPWGVPRKLP